MRSLFVAICGAPNVGKSTLVNNMVGHKISITSHKPQTTRFSIKGIKTEKDVQLVFIDTPGIIKPSKKIEKKLVNSAYNGIKESSLACLVLDAKNGITHTARNIINSLMAEKRDAIACINKIDLISDQNLMKLTERVYNIGFTKEVFVISATKDQGVSHLLRYLQSQAKDSVWYYNDTDVTDRNLHFLAAELTREKIFRMIHQEIPYDVHVKTETLVYDEDPMSITQDISVKRLSQKTIIMGAKNAMIKKIIEAAKSDMEELFNKKINLHLSVTVSDAWQDDL